VSPTTVFGGKDLTSQEQKDDLLKNDETKKKAGDYRLDANFGPLKFSIKLNPLFTLELGWPNRERERPQEIQALQTAVSVANSFSLAGIVTPLRKSHEGTLIKAARLVWLEVVKYVIADFSRANEIPPNKWEEIIAGAYSEAGFEEVTLTPQSGDHGRDVIAIKRGVGSIKIIGSVKAYKPGNLVGYDDIRALLGVLSGERDASKGIITTTSDFPPKVKSDPFLAPFMPTRLELMNGKQLHAWLSELSKKT
jgi:restriction system protein